MTKKTAATTQVEEVSRATRVVLLRGKGCVSCTGYKLPCCVKKMVTRQRGLFIRAPRTFSMHFHMSMHARGRIVFVSQGEGAMAIHLDDRSACRRDCSGLLVSAKTAPIGPPLPNVSSRKVFALHGIGSASQVGRCTGRRTPQETMMVNTKFVKLRVTRGLRTLKTGMSVMRVTGRIVAPVSFSVTSLMRRRLVSGKMGLCLRRTMTSFRGANERVGIIFGSKRSVPTSVMVLSVKMHPRAALTHTTKLIVKRTKNVSIGSCLRASSRSVCTVKSTVRCHRPVAKGP